MNNQEKLAWRVAYEDEILEAIDEVTEPLEAQIERLQAAVLLLASMVDHLHAKESPYYPMTLQGPLPLHPDDMIDCWFGTWEETAKRLSATNDPRWGNDPETVVLNHLRVTP